jgi:hypothetical protein
MHWTTLETGSYSVYINIVSQRAQKVGREEAVLPLLLLLL